MPRPIRPRRSVLYMPGSNVRALEKAKDIPADALIFDLEDAVAPDAKDEARRQVCDAIRGGGYGNKELIVRVNGLTSPWGREDIVGPRPAARTGCCCPRCRARATSARCSRSWTSPTRRSRRRSGA